MWTYIRVDGAILQESVAGGGDGSRIASLRRSNTAKGQEGAEEQQEGKEEVHLERCAVGRLSVVWFALVGRTLFVDGSVRWKLGVDKSRGKQMNGI